MPVYQNSTIKFTLCGTGILRARSPPHPTRRFILCETGILPVYQNSTIKFTPCGTGILPVSKKVKSHLSTYKIP
ncbi:hypothetical protein QUB17_06620 [Microcoleus sp. B5-C4]